MKTGRKATPTAVKRTNGNPGKRPLNENEPQPTGGLGDAPETFNDRAKAAWGRIAPSLYWLTVADRETFGSYCELIALKEECESTLAANGGAWITANNGRAYRHPAQATWLECVTRLRLFACEFGGTPSSRAGLHIDKMQEPNSLEKFLAEYDEERFFDKSRYFTKPIAGKVG